MEAENFITVIEARFKPDYFPMKIGTKWKIGPQISSNVMRGSDYWAFPRGNKAKGVDTNGNLYVLWIYVGDSNRLQFALSSFDEETSYRAIDEDGNTSMYYP